MNGDVANVTETEIETEVNPRESAMAAARRLHWTWQAEVGRR